MNDNSDTLRRVDSLVRNGDCDTAKALLDGLLTNDPNCVQALAKRAYVHDSAGRVEAAIRDVSAAIAICDSEPALFDKRARLLFRAQLYRDAVADCTRALALCDQHQNDYYRAPAHFLRADAYIRLKDFNRATDDLALVPDGHTAWTDRLRNKTELVADCRKSSC